MKAKRPVLVILAFAILGTGFWWFMRSLASTSEDSTQVSTSAKVDAPKLVMPPARVELPKAPAVPAGGSSILPANPLPDPNDPQADLKTAIPDIVHWLRVNDILTLKTNYTPPNTLTPEQLEQWQESMVRSKSYAAQSTDPNFRAAMQRTYEGQLKEFESFENQTPTYNSTGDDATYTYKRDPLIDGDDSLTTVTFVKINGKWYFKYH